jgi:hypothetical protein
MAPHVTVTYTCTLAGVTASFTNTVDATATTQAGPKITTSATASVTIQAPPPPVPVSLTNPKTGAAESRPATLTVSELDTVKLNTPKPKIALTLTLSKATTLVLTLLNSKDRKLVEWIEHEKPGSHKLSLLLPPLARHKGHDTLRITETGSRKPKTLPVALTG